MSPTSHSQTKFGLHFNRRFAVTCKNCMDTVKTILARMHSMNLASKITVTKSVGAMALDKVI